MQRGCFSREYCRRCPAVTLQVPLSESLRGAKNEQAEATKPVFLRQVFRGEMSILGPSPKFTRTFLGVRSKLVGKNIRKYTLKWEISSYARL